jgi:hypothetical protein
MCLQVVDTHFRPASGSTRLQFVGDRCWDGLQRDRGFLICPRLVPRAAERMIVLLTHQLSVV